MSNRSPLLNVIFQSINNVRTNMLRDFGEIENLQVSAKGPGDFVSSADKRTEKILINELQKAHPEYGIVTEEAGTINKSNKISLDRFIYSIGIRHIGQENAKILASFFVSIEQFSNLFKSISNIVS